MSHARQGQAGFLQGRIAADAVREVPLFVTALLQLVTQLPANTAPRGMGEEVPRDGGASPAGGESDQGPDPGAVRPRFSVIQNRHLCQNWSQGQTWSQGQNWKQGQNRNQGGDNAARAQR